MKKIMLTGIALAFFATANAAFIYNWATRTGAANGDRGKCISNPVNNTIASSGWFQGTVDFDPSVFGMANLTSAGGTSPSDMYLLNYNLGGSLNWVRLITGTGVEDPMSIVTSPSNGNVYVCGRFSGVADFDPSPGGVYNLSTSGLADYDGFLACYSSAGVLVWALDIGNGGTGRDAFYGIAFDGAGNVMVCGEFTGTVNFNPLGGAVNVANYGATGTDGFIARYSSAAGTIVGAYAYALGGTLDDCARGIHVNPSTGDVYVTGWFTSASAQFDPAGSAAGIISPLGGTDIFTLRWTGSTFVWVRGWGTTSNDFGMDVMFYGNSVVITGGIGVGSATFGTLTHVVTGTGTDAFMAGYSTTGGQSWFTPFTGTSDDLGQNIASDNNGYVYCTGYFTSVSIDPYDWLTGTYTGAINNTGAAGTSDIFYARYNTSGHQKDVWTTGSTGDEDCPGLFGWRNPTGGTNEMFVTGSFSLTTNFDPLGAGSKTSAGLRDIFIAKYNWTTPLRMAGQLSSAADFHFYPNPTDGQLYLENLVENSTVELYAMDGKLIGSWMANESSLVLQVGEFENGVYMMRITNPDGEIKNERVVVQH